jgi:hypothetical protein
VEYVASKAESNMKGQEARGQKRQNTEKGDKENGEK